MYTNTEYDLSKELPKEIRLDVYKKAIDIIENDIDDKKVNFGIKCKGLCLILPCILWNLKSLNELTPKGKDWSYDGAKIAFIEIRKHINKLSKIPTERESNIYRLEILKNIVKQLENEN